MRWIAYLLPLTYFNEISRGVMLRAEPIGALWQPLLILGLLGVVVVTLATLRFRAFLAPAGRRHRGRAVTGAGPGRRDLARRALRRGGAGDGGERMTGPAARDPRRRPASPAGPSWGARGVFVTYGKTRALDDIWLPAPSGQVTVVVGGDGAGKTTLLRCLAGALAPDAGEVRTPGARRIGYLPAGSGTYPDLTVAENLAFRAAAYGLPASRARERSAELITKAGLAAARDRLAGQLSGGMRQKLGVIAALLPQPDLLILDEPTTGIDPVSRAGLWRLIAGAAAAGAAVVLATTYLDEAERAASVLVLADGQSLGTGTPDQIVAAMPGAIVGLAARPPTPTGPGAGAGAVTGGSGRRPAPRCRPGSGSRPDLQDAVTVAALAREPQPEPPRPPGPVPAPRPVGARGRPRGRAEAGDGAGAANEADGAAGRAPGTRPAARTGLAPAADAGGAPLAECAAVTRRFGHFTAVREVSLRVGPGEIVGLLGANGAGKTTLIRMLLGLLPASGGTIALFGEPPSRATRRRIGYVPQGLGLYDDLTVAENLSFSAAVFGGPADGPRADGRPIAAGAGHPGRAAAAGRAAAGRVRAGPGAPARSADPGRARRPAWIRSAGPGCGIPSGQRPRRAPGCW